MLAAKFRRTFCSTEQFKHHLGLELGTEISSLRHLALLLNSLSCLGHLSKFWGALQMLGSAFGLGQAEMEFI